MIYVAKGLNGLLKQYIRKIMEIFPSVRYVRVVDKNIQPEVEKALLELGLNNVKIV